MPERYVIQQKSHIIDCCDNEGTVASDLLNAVYGEIGEKIGLDIAIEIYRMFRGQQINFPVRLFNPSKIRQMIREEYDGKNVRKLAIKYNYSEKTVRRIVREGGD